MRVRYWTLDQIATLKYLELNDKSFGAAPLDSLITFSRHGQRRDFCSGPGRALTFVINRRLAVRSLGRRRRQKAAFTAVSSPLERRWLH